MDDETRLLDGIEAYIVAHGGDLGGWTAHSAGELMIFDGRISLRAEVVDHENRNVVHAHVFATLHGHDGEVLDACVLGMGEDRDAAIAQAATLWVQGVGAPIRSLLDDREVCMASGVEMDGRRAYAGPLFPRGLDDSTVAALDESLPWFRFATEAAAPRRVHLAKVTISTNGTAGWTRQLELDGHEVSHHDGDWPAGVTSSRAGYVTRFVVFELSPDEVERRAEVDAAILHFAERYPRGEPVDDLVADMVRRGFDPDLAHEAEIVSTLAFGRHFFEPRGVPYPSSVIRARADGQVQADVPLLSIPAYSRARALAPGLQQAMAPDEFASLCMHSAESAAILKGLEAEADLDLTTVTMFPCVVPDREASDETMDAALRLQQQIIGRTRPVQPAGRPWWKLW